MKKRKRCKWVDLNNSVYVKYHDLEWGVPVHNDKLLFEMLILEGAQAGLAWSTILAKRKGYKKAFENFVVEKVAKYDENEIDAMLKNNGIIRNHLKVCSAIRNAKNFIEIQKEFGSFDKYIWSFTDGKVIQDNLINSQVIPTKTKLSEKISKELKQRGMSFVGPTIVYAFMQAVGIVNGHEKSCFRYKKLS